MTATGGQAADGSFPDAQPDVSTAGHLPAQLDPTAADDAWLQFPEAEFDSVEEDLIDRCANRAEAILVGHRKISLDA